MVDPEIIERAAQLLRRGGLVALPTETVYGLGADAENELAVRRIFAAKGRPPSHPLIVHVADALSTRSWARQWTQSALKLADAFWPGPLTMVLLRSERASDAITGGQDTVALRVPAHPVMRRVLAAFGGGIAAPSANRFGGVSATTAEHVRADLGENVDLIVDAGPCQIGIESTIVDVSTELPAVLRPGAVSREELERVLSSPVLVRDSGIRAPGLMRSHYAPRAGVELLASGAIANRVDELRSSGKRVAVVAAEAIELPIGATRFAIPDDAAGFGRDLYATFREIDRQSFDLILVVPPPSAGLGWAIRDRLARAASPRG
jgi:L-threonylcarbamoyladenylate synthase